MLDFAFWIQCRSIETLVLSVYMRVVFPTICVQCIVAIGVQSGTSQVAHKLQHVFPFVFVKTIDLVSQMSHAINPPSYGKKGGAHKNLRVSKTLRCVSQRKLARKQNTGLPKRKLALWPRREVICRWKPKQFPTILRDERPL